MTEVEGLRDVIERATSQQTFRQSFIGVGRDQHDRDVREFVQAEIRQTLAKFSGVSFALTSFLSERIDETVSGSRAQWSARSSATTPT